MPLWGGYSNSVGVSNYAPPKRNTFMSVLGDGGATIVTSQTCANCTTCDC